VAEGHGSERRLANRGVSERDASRVRRGVLQHLQRSLGVHRVGLQPRRGGLLPHARGAIVPPPGWPHRRGAARRVVDLRAHVAVGPHGKGRGVATRGREPRRAARQRHRRFLLLQQRGHRAVLQGGGRAGGAEHPQHGRLGHPRRHAVEPEAARPRGGDGGWRSLVQHHPHPLGGLVLLLLRLPAGGRRPGLPRGPRGPRVGGGAPVHAPPQRPRRLVVSLLPLQPGRVRRAGARGVRGALPPPQPRGAGPGMAHPRHARALRRLWRLPLER